MLCPGLNPGLICARQTLPIELHLWAYRQCSLCVCLFVSVSPSLSRSRLLPLQCWGLNTGPYGCYTAKLSTTELLGYIHSPLPSFLIKFWLVTFVLGMNCQLKNTIRGTSTKVMLNSLRIFLFGFYIGTIAYHGPRQGIGQIWPNTFLFFADELFEILPYPCGSLHVLCGFFV